MKLDKHVVDMFSELTKPTDDVKMEKTCFGTISIVDGTRYVKLDGSDLLVPAASTVKTSHGDRVTVLMKNHSLTITGNLTAPATDGEGGSSGEAGTAATIEVGTVTTGEAGSSASVTNSGTASAAVFDFVIPRGDKGEKGDTGPQGPQGEKGDTGTWDGIIPDHQHAVSDILNFPTSLPARGGNADTLDGLHANEIVSNPNLLINPDFKINQRSQSTYTGAKYTVDRWYSHYCIVSVSDGYITITKDALTGNQSLRQYLPPEVFRYLCGKTVTFSVDCDIKVAGNVVLQYCADGVYGRETRFTDTGRKIRTVTMKLPDTITSSLAFLISLNAPATELTSVDLYSAKLELGSIATPFCPPDPATELAKCQRYFYRLGGLEKKFVLQGLAYSPTSMSFTCQFPVEMRTLPTLSVSEGNWRFCIRKIPHENGHYWNNEYGFVFSLDANVSYSQRVSINVDFDDTKSTIITAGDPVTIFTNNDIDSNGNQKYPGWLDFNAEL